MHYFNRSLRLHAVALCAFSLALPLAAENHELDAKGLPNFMKVNEHVFRGAQPSDAGLQELAKMGIKTILDLRESGDRSVAEERVVKAAGMTYVSVPMAGMSAPTSAQMLKVLALLNDETAGPVFVHCRRGADRTGAVIAAYHIDHHNWDNARALKDANAHSMSMFQLPRKAYIMGFRARTLDAKTAAPAAPVAVAATVN